MADDDVIVEFYTTSNEFICEVVCPRTDWDLLMGACEERGCTFQEFIIDALRSFVGERSKG